LEANGGEALKTVLHVT